jgi:hypothetical protein
MRSLVNEMPTPRPTAVRDERGLPNVLALVVIAIALACLGGVAVAEERNDPPEPLEHKHRPAPVRQLRPPPVRGERSSDDADDDSKIDELSPKHDKSDARGGRGQKDDDDDE